MHGHIILFPPLSFLCLFLLFSVAVQMLMDLFAVTVFANGGGNIINISRDDRGKIPRDEDINQASGIKSHRAISDSTEALPIV